MSSQWSPHADCVDALLLARFYNCDHISGQPLANRHAVQRYMQDIVCDICEMPWIMHEALPHSAGRAVSAWRCSPSRSSHTAFKLVFYWQGDVDRLLQRRGLATLADLQAQREQVAKEGQAQAKARRAHLQCR